VRRLENIRLTKCNTELLDIIGELKWEDVHKEKRPEKKREPEGIIRETEACSVGGNEDTCRA
jgi:hypothetical protein